MTEPAVSVILPTYNRAATLGRALRSVLAQTFTDFEVIVVDDASTDATSTVLAAFSDQRLRIFQRVKQGGPATARNDGIAMAKAPLLAFQDSDDEWLVDKLRRQMLALTAAPLGTGLICGGYIVQSQKGGAWYQGADERMRRGAWDAGNIYDFSFITPTWLLTKRALECSGGFDHTLPNLEDWELAFRLFQYAGIIALDEPLVLKHGGTDSVNWSIEKRVKSLAAILERHAGLWQEHPEILSKLNAELGSTLCRSGDLAIGRKYLSAAIRLDAGKMKPYLHLAASLLGQRAYSTICSS